MDEINSTIAFGRWKRWHLRDRPSQNLEVPVKFGILGLYILATADVDEITDAYYAKQYLHSSVLYIGMSRHVDTRLERTHKAVNRYRAMFNDNECKNLRYAIWYSSWTSHGYRVANDSQSVVANAKLALFERALLLSYAQMHGRLPLFNIA
jgi:hypothetical protein